MAVKVLRKPTAFTRIQALPDRVKAGVAVKGDAAAYALVWEWGTLRFHGPGPKTQFGSNPDDPGIKIFTKTAPSGYIRIHRQQFFDMAKAALLNINMTQEIQAGTLGETLRHNLMTAATEAAQLMAKDAPIDTGLLRASIYAVDQPEVDTLLRESFRPLLIGGTAA